MTCKYLVKDGTNEPLHPCGKPTYCRGLCSLHYTRQMRGKPMDGEKNASRLTRAQLDDIMTSREAPRDLALKHKVSLSYIRRLRQGRAVPKAAADGPVR